MGRHITEHGGSLRKIHQKHSAMEKSNFDQLLQRYLTGQVTEQERTKIEAWLDVMKTEDNSDLELSKEEEDGLFQKIKSESSNVDDVISLVPPKRSNWNYWLKIAAAILLLAIASFTITRIINNEDIPLFATNTKVEKLILNDGSLVWLRGKSSLQYYHKNENSTTVRFAELQGEGLFEVAKDPQRPFIIKCGDVNVKVVGTSFNLRSSGDTVEVTVLTGKVNLTSLEGSSIDVLPNEKAIYRGTGGFEKMALGEQEQNEITSHTEYHMAFDNADMRRLIKKLEDKFNVDVQLENDAINRCRITIDLTDHSLEQSLQMITDVLHVQYTITGKTVTLAGSGCD